MPERIQLSRARGWRKPDGAVVVARPTKWGNPFPVMEVYRAFPSLTEQGAHQHTVHDFRSLVTSKARRFERSVRQSDGSRQLIVYTYAPTVADIRTELGGRDLACWCEPELPCHADVLLELANRRERHAGVDPR